MPFGGVFSVLPTPFSASGDVDLDSLRRIVDLFIADGVDGFTALGVTSEVARLTEAERDRVRRRHDWLCVPGDPGEGRVALPSGRRRRRGPRVLREGSAHAL